MHATYSPPAQILRNIALIYITSITPSANNSPIPQCTRFPDGSDAGFWVRCFNGLITVGAGPLPEMMGPADALTLGMYTPVVPIGRSVNIGASEADKLEQEAYISTALGFDKELGRRPVEQTSPTGKEMPAALARVFAPATR